MSKQKRNGAPAVPSAPRATKESKTEAAYLLSLTLENVRCFGERQTIDLSDGNGRPAQWTILLGNNGTGKTTVLQVLVAFEFIDAPATQQTLFPYGIVMRFRDYDPTFSRDNAAEKYIRLEIARGSPLGSTSPTYQIEELHCGGPVVGGEGRSPLCYAFGASRRLGVGALSEPEEDDATATLFSDQVSLRNAEEWLLQTDYAASKPSAYRALQKRRRDQVLDLLLHVLPDVDDIRFTNTGGVRPIARVEFKTPYGWVPLRQLGYGYRTLIAWMVDFASRMVERYPDSPDPLAEPAVVLVDEIDLHLHPKWQRQLISYLTERFPNTQFIATAHSPLIVQAANGVGANLAILKRQGDHVIIENNPVAWRGWSVDQLLTSELYDLPSPYPPQYDELFARRDKLLTKSKLTKADEKELARLDKEMGELPLGDTMAQTKDRMAINKALDLLQRRLDSKS